MGNGMSQFGFGEFFLPQSYSLFYDCTKLYNSVYEDKKRATDNETLNFTTYRALWISVLSVVPELKQRRV